MDMCSFYRTATRYRTRHHPFPNELLYALAVLHPLMLKEGQVIRRTTKKLSHIIRQDYVGQLTDEWKIYHGRYPRVLVHHWTSRRWIQHLLNSWQLEKSVRDAKLNSITTLLFGRTYIYMSYQILWKLTLRNPWQCRSWEESVGEQQGTH